MTADEMRSYLRKHYGIKTDAELVEEHKNTKINIGFFVIKKLEADGNESCN